MKRLISTILFLFLIITIGYSQVQLNVQGGVNLTHPTKVDNYSYRATYRFGVIADIPIANLWSFQTGLEFLNRQYRCEIGRAHV